MRFLRACALALVQLEHWFLTRRNASVWQRFHPKHCQRSMYGLWHKSVNRAIQRSIPYVLLC